MALSIYASNRLEQLVDAFAVVAQQPLSSPLVPEQIVVQSRGMQRWLSMALARKFGVWANCEYPFPNAAIQSLFSAVLPDSSVSSRMSKQTLTWRILHTLPALLAEPEFAPLCGYLQDEIDSLKAYQLAGKIADSFDQYSLFRDDMLESWEQGHGEGWQPILWRALIADTEGYHRGQLSRMFLKKLSEETPLDTELPERLSLFGISYLPERHLHHLTAIAQWTDIHMFLLSPTREYWADIRARREQIKLSPQHRELRIEGNPLLASLGRLGREFSDMIIDASEQAHIDQDIYLDCGEDTLLQALQSDILNLRSAKPGEIKRPLVRNDLSVMLQSCHSPMREVEVLHDQLLFLFEQHTDLTPADVLVMTSDIENYAPYISAVFGAERCAEKRFPFAIADRSLADSGEISALLQKLLLLPTARLTLVELLDFIESAPICERFDIAPDEIEQMRRWLDDVRVRWGADAEDRARLDLPSYAQNSLQAGLDRLLLGFAMATDGSRMFNDQLPCDGAEGSSAITLGKLCQLVQLIIEARERLALPQTLSDWGSELKTLLATFVCENDINQRELDQIGGLATELITLQNNADYLRPISAEIFRSWISSQLENSEQSYGFMTGGVTFCAMLPMRSIPFRVIALLGMNDDAFPRQGRAPGFDLIAQQPRRGDRSLREEDRYLFLEAILSARDVLYISYVGQSPRDNGEIPPSVLVSEFLDCIDQNFTIDGKPASAHLLTKHRLQAFSPIYFSGQSTLFSYSSANCAQRPASNSSPPFGLLLTSPLPEPDSSLKQIDLDRLLRFYDNPARFFLEQRLQLTITALDEPLEEKEPFMLGHLDAYLLKDDLIEAALRGDDPRDSFTAIRARGVLPPGEPGTVAFEELLEQVTQFTDKLTNLCNGHSRRDDLEFDLRVGEFSLGGRLSSLWNHAQIRYRCSSFKAKDLMRLWIRHLVLNLLAQSDPDLPDQSFLLMRDKSVHLSAITDPRVALQQVLDLYWEGLCRPLPYAAETTLAFSHKLSWNEDKARKVWFGSDFKAGEIKDTYLKRCFGENALFGSEFDRVARLLMTPLLSHLGG